MTADKGLAGAFNANLIRVGEIMHREDANRKWYPVGNKARTPSAGSVAMPFAYGRAEPR